MEECDSSGNHVYRSRKQYHKFFRNYSQLSLSGHSLKWTDTSLRRTANLVPAKLQFSLCNWTLFNCGHLYKLESGHFFKKCWFENLSKRTLDVYANLWLDLNIVQSDDRYVSGIYQFVWDVLASLGWLKEMQPVCHVIIVHCKKALVSIWRFGYFQVTWTVSKVDTFVKQTVALVLRVSALERELTVVKIWRGYSSDFLLPHSILQ